MSQQNPEPPAAGEPAPDRTGGVGDHVPETPDSGDVDHLEGEFGELNRLIEPAGVDRATTDSSGDETPDADGR